jgi:hypothetical protein
MSEIHPEVEITRSEGPRQHLSRDPRVTRTFEKRGGASARDLLVTRRLGAARGAPERGPPVLFDEFELANFVFQHETLDQRLDMYDEFRARSPNSPRWVRRMARPRAHQSRDDGGSQ